MKAVQKPRTAHRETGDTLLYHCDLTLFKCIETQFLRPLLPTKSTAHCMLRYRKGFVKAFSQRSLQCTPTRQVCENSIRFSWRVRLGWPIPFTDSAQLWSLFFTFYFMVKCRKFNQSSFLMLPEARFRISVDNFVGFLSGDRTSSEHSKSVLFRVFQFMLYWQRSL